MFSFYIWDLNITLDELFYDMIREAKNPELVNKKERIQKIIDEWEKYRDLQGIYTRMDELKYDKVDWERGEKDGIFSLVNHYQFEELKPWREKAIKDYLKDNENIPENKEYCLKTIKELREKYEKSP